MGLPAGFKPNHDLDTFLGNLILDVLALWDILTSELTLLEPYIVYLIGFLGMFGLSF